MMPDEETGERLTVEDLLGGKKRKRKPKPKKPVEKSAKSTEGKTTKGVPNKDGLRKLLKHMEEFLVDLDSRMSVVMDEPTVEWLEKSDMRMEFLAMLSVGQELREALGFKNKGSLHLTAMVKSLSPVHKAIPFFSPDVPLERVERYIALQLESLPRIYGPAALPTMLELVGHATGLMVVVQNTVRELLAEALEAAKREAEE